jgi:phosphocarrier protein
MAARSIEIVNQLGLHARAAAKLVQLANRFESEILLRKDGKEANAKSIMAVMMLAAGRGSVIEISTSGVDEQPALQALTELIENRFGEDK